jgi:hypothetical protein
MPHPSACAFQQAGRVVERRTGKEADVHVGAEGVDVPKRGVSHARRGVAVLQKFADVRTAAAHLFEPWLSHQPQLVVRLGKPNIDAWVTPHGAREPEELVHAIRLPAWRVMSSLALELERHPLGERQAGAMVHRVGRAAHVGPPGVGAGLTAAPGLLFAAERAADLGA